MATSKSKPNTCTPDKPSIMTCDFEIHGKLPKEAFELFAAAQALIVGIRGYIMLVSDDHYKGQLQGEDKVIEAFKQLIASAAEFMAAVQEFIIKNMKVIEEYTYETFEVRKGK